MHVCNKSNIHTVIDKFKIALKTQQKIFPKTLDAVPKMQYNTKQEDSQNESGEYDSTLPAQNNQPKQNRRIIQ